MDELSMKTFKLIFPYVIIFVLFALLMKERHAHRKTYNEYLSYLKEMNFELSEQQCQLREILYDTNEITTDTTEYERY